MRGEIVPLASLDDLHLAFGQRVILDGVGFAMERGERVGLIGDNGSGKSTLLKMLAGLQAPDAGRVGLARSAKLGYLAQDPIFDSDGTVLDEAELAFGPLHDMARALRELEHDMAEQQDDSLQRTLKRYQSLQHEFDLAGGYAWRHKLEAILLGVGLPQPTWEQPVESLSGGQRSRLALAKLLIGEPDLLLLDEPTNHLDLDAVAWLEDWLLRFDGGVLLVSHDRYLLDRLCTRVVLLERAKLKSYPGNYTAFLRQRETELLTQQREYEKQQAYVARQQEFIRRFSAGQRAREAQGRSKRLERLLKSDQMIDAVGQKRRIHLHLETEQRSGDQVLRVSDLGKSFGTTTLWKGIGFRLQRGERVGIIGPNGSGKTTLLRTLLGELDADTGDIRWGANLTIGYYDQRLDDFDPDVSVYDHLLEGRTGINDKSLRDTLALMLFRGDDVHKPMGVLSGGERARVALAGLLLDKPNVLLLDEPTNHLDIASCEALEAALDGFPGTILCVSHDRFFLQKVTRRLLILQPPDVIDFDGRFSDWVTRQQSLAAAPTTRRENKTKPKDRSAVLSTARSLAGAPSTKPARPVKDNPYKRPFGRLSVAELETEIHACETAIVGLQSRFGDPRVMRDPSAVQRLTAELEQASERLRQLEAEYFAREA